MYQIDFHKPLHIHFIGIGGISMSGLAEILLEENFRISGSDAKSSPLTRTLEERGAVIYYGQRASNIKDDVDVVVYTAAIHPDNPEFACAKEKGFPMLTRAELLGQIMRNYDTPIAISGTHGKTTTTSMVSHILLEGDCDPTISVGGILPAIHGNIRVGNSETFITEACEYTNSFLSFFPKISVILNMDADHLDFFKDLDDIRHSFRLFAEKLDEKGLLIINRDIKNYEEISGGLPCRVVTFGHSSESDYSAADITYDAFARPTFTLTEQGKKAGTITLGVPGEHNVYNALAGTAVGLQLGLSIREIAQGIASVQTIAGRTNLLHVKGMTVIDDCYNANPVSMKASIDVLAHTSGRRIAVLGDMGELGAEEKELHRSIGKAVAASGIDALFCAGTLAEEYASEAKANPECEVHYKKTREEMTEELLAYVKEGDTVLVKASHFMEFPKVVEALTKE